MYTKANYCKAELVIIFQTCSDSPIDLYRTSGENLKALADIDKETISFAWMGLGNGGGDGDVTCPFEFKDHLISSRLDVRQPYPAHHPSISSLH